MGLGTFTLHLWKQRAGELVRGSVEEGGGGEVSTFGARASWSVQGRAGLCYYMIAANCTPSGSSARKDSSSKAGRDIESPRFPRE